MSSRPLRTPVGHLARPAGPALAVLCLLLACPALLSAATGLVVSRDASSWVSVLDTDTDSIAATRLLIGGGEALDCAVHPRDPLGLVADFSRRVWFVDMPDPADPVLSRLPLSIPAEDISLNVDGSLAVVCGSLPGDPLAVVDVAARLELGVSSLVEGCQAVEVCPDGSVLVLDGDDQQVRRLVLASDGTLTDTGESLAITGGQNLLCSPTSTWGAVLKVAPAEVEVFSVPGLAPVDRWPVPAPLSGVVRAGADALLVHSTDNTVTLLEVDPATGAFSPDNPAAVTGGGGASQPFFGVDQMALDTASNRIYLSDAAAPSVEVLEAATAAAVGAILDPGLRDPRGVCLPPPLPLDLDGKRVLCHVPPGNPDNPRTLRVGEAALKAHLGEDGQGLHGGDTPGPCPR